MITCFLTYDDAVTRTRSRSVSDERSLLHSLRLLVMVIILSAAGSVPAIFAENSAITEYHIKAAFLYNFAKFVDWPDEALGDDSTPFTLCVLGIEPYISVRESLAGKHIKGHQVEVKRVNGAADAGTCQMLFVSAEASAAAGADLTDIDAHALTVGETQDFIQRGGVINLKTVDNKVRFEINRTAGERFGFRFSAQLLKLAILVGREP